MGTLIDAWPKLHPSPERARHAVTAPGLSKAACTTTRQGLVGLFTTHGVQSQYHAGQSTQLWMVRPLRQSQTDVLTPGSLPLALLHGFLLLAQAASCGSSCARSSCTRLGCSTTRWVRAAGQYTRHTLVTLLTLPTLGIKHTHAPLTPPHPTTPSSHTTLSHSSPSTPCLITFPDHSHPHRTCRLWSGT